MIAGMCINLVKPCIAVLKTRIGLDAGGLHFENPRGVADSLY
jgi:hypothetical protein